MPPERDLGISSDAETSQFLAMTLSPGDATQGQDEMSTNEAIEVLRSTGKFDLLTPVEDLDFSALCRLYHRLTGRQQLIFFNDR